MSACTPWMHGTALKSFGMVLHGITPMHDTWMHHAQEVPAPSNSAPCHSSALSNLSRCCKAVDKPLYKPLCTPRTPHCSRPTYECLHTRRLPHPPPLGPSHARAARPAAFSPQPRQCCAALHRRLGQQPLRGWASLLCIGHAVQAQRGGAARGAGEAEPEDAVLSGDAGSRI